MLEKLNRFAADRRFYAAAVMLVLLFTGMRLVHINADAPQNLTISAASYTDEGFKTYDARNYALFGDWKWTPEDEYDGWAGKSPLTALPYAWIFRHFGVSYASIRALSVLYAAITMILLFVFLVRNYGRLTGLIGLILFGTNYFTAMFNRLGMFESHLICYIMLCILGFSEAFRPFRGRRGGESETSYTLKKIGCRAAFIAIGFLGFAGGFFIKRNLLLILPALTPAALIYIATRFNRSERFMNRVFILFIAAFLVLYLPFAQSSVYKVNLAFLLMSVQVFGQPIAVFLPFTAFDPLQNVLLKSMYMEFVFLHPFTFFAGFLFSLYTFHQYIFGRRRVTADLFLASWLMFGFIFTNVMYYSPSRYYLITVIPLIALAARLIADFPNLNIGAFFTGKKRFPHNLIFAIFMIFALLYTGIVFIEQAVPTALRNNLVDRLYPSFLKGDYADGIILIAAAAAVCLGCIAATLTWRKRLVALLHDPKLPAILLSLILALQLYQYGAWFLLHDHALYRASKELGAELPRDAILAGSWSAGLVVENNMKALILQSLIPYNHNLVRKILYDAEIPINRLRDGKKETAYENNVPVYMAVCRNVIFEKTIVDTYRDHFVPENLVKSVRLGYFKVDVFKMKKSRLEIKNAAQTLFNTFF
jgi:4-amino-4-deoxy-L-arabinose transferase-like glycosyltransferase